MMDRLTPEHGWNNACYDPWEICGLDNVCKRSCVHPEPCKIPKMLCRLADYENTGLTPEEVVSLNTFTDSQCEKLLAKNGELEKEIKRLRIKLGDAGTVCHGCPYPRKYKKLEKELAHYKQLEADGRKLRPLEDWGEDYGDVLWWKLPIEEPPYCGSPLDCNFPDYVTHWTMLIYPEQALKERGEND